MATKRQKKRQVKKRQAKKNLKEIGIDVKNDEVRYVKKMYNELKDKGLPDEVIKKLSSRERETKRFQFSNKREEGKLKNEYVKTKMAENKHFFGLSKKEVDRAKKLDFKQLEKAVAKGLDVKDGGFIDYNERQEHARDLSRFAYLEKLYKDGKISRRPDKRKRFNGVTVKEIEKQAEELNDKAGFEKGNKYGYGLLMRAYQNGWTIEQALTFTEVDTDAMANYVINEEAVSTFRMA